MESTFGRCEPPPQGNSPLLILRHALVEVLQVVDIHIAVQIHVAGHLVAAGRRFILRQAFIDGRHVQRVG